ncbi:MAG: hypothetical protein KIS92_25050 [Planctomycetota bacterium]|nr:hypothetical protein [Planctomycetota bacterium]
MAAEFSEKTKLLITVGIVALVNVGIWGLAYKARGTYQLEEEKLKKVTKIVNDLQKEVDRKEEFTAELNKQKRTSEKKEKMLPELHERDKFIFVLADLAQKKSMQVKPTAPPRYDLTVEGIPGLMDAQNFRRDIWSFSGAADFKGICEYLNVLEEHFQRFLSIEGLSINTTNSGMNVTGVAHDVNFQIITYRYVEQH